MTTSPSRRPRIPCVSYYRRLPMNLMNLNSLINVRSNPHATRRTATCYHDVLKKIRCVFNWGTPAYKKKDRDRDIQCYPFYEMGANYHIYKHIVPKMKSRTLETYKQMNILNELLKTHDIQYVAVAGTILGLNRHGGTIPGVIRKYWFAL